MCWLTWNTELRNLSDRQDLENLTACSKGQKIRRFPTTASSLLRKKKNTNNSENNFNRTIKRLFYPTRPLEFVNRPEKGNHKSTSNIQKNAKFSQSNERIHVLTSLQYKGKGKLPYPLLSRINSNVLFINSTRSLVSSASALHRFNSFNCHVPMTA